mgnify:FL=1|tara:strand:+ start:348 stop:671 length:324 start_codon:yes stop_codon:yes gene_type:complete
MSSAEAIANAVIRQEVSPRGGGIEIWLDEWGYPGHKMSAYQNYLGGGMLGKVCSDCTIIDYKDIERLNELSEELKKFYHKLSNSFYDDDEWASASYEQNQKRNVSAY